MSELPVLENAYRDFLTKEHELHEMFLDSKREYMNEHHGGAEIPEQVALPGAIPWSLSENTKLAFQKKGSLKPVIDMVSGMDLPDRSDGYLEKYYEVHGDTRAEDSFWMRHLFYASYARTRHTYHIKPALHEELSDMEWPADAPAETLKYLPLPAFGMKMPDGRIYTVAYDLRSGREHTGELELRVGLLQRDRSIKPISVLHLVGTIDEALEKAIETIVEGGSSPFGPGGIPGGDPEKFEQQIRANTEEIINLLLYLAGEDDIVERAGHYPSSFKRHERGLEGTSFEEELDEDPSEADVGVRMQRALRQYKTERERAESDGEGPEKAPHIRRPHPHLYWTGEGREIPKIKYLGPTPVNMDEENPEPQPTTQEVE